MSEHQHFLDAIIEEPEEDAHRLVYADYLEELGDERGEFIRLQCQRKQLVPYTEEYQECVKREGELLDAYESKWISQLEAPGQQFEFDRGFIRRVELRASQFLQDGPTIMRRAPLELVRLPYLKGQVQKLADAGLLEQLRGIDISGLKLPLDQFELLLSSMPNLIRLRADHSSNSVNRDFAKAILDSPGVEQLEHLQLANSRIESGFYQLLKSGGGLPSLKSLTFGNAMLGGPRPVHFDKIKFPAMEELQVRGTVRVNDMKEFAALGPLRHIEFRYGSMPERGLRAMVEAGSFAEAEKVVLYASRLSDKSLDLLLKSELSSCRYLEMAVPLSDEICAAVANCGSLGSLEMFAGDFTKKQQKTYFADLPSYIVRGTYDF